MSEEGLKQQCPSGNPSMPERLVKSQKPDCVLQITSSQPWRLFQNSAERPRVSAAPAEPTRGLRICRICILKCTCEPVHTSKCPYFPSPVYTHACTNKLLMHIYAYIHAVYTCTHYIYIPTLNACMYFVCTYVYICVYIYI